VRANNSELLEKIAGGDWSDDTQAEVESAVSKFAEDFGFDLDEEGHPLDDSGEGQARAA
jgi:F-type H+-transporting ATPase subunit alpha